jgi:hypothetical protein
MIAHTFNEDSMCTICNYQSDLEIDSNEYVTTAIILKGEDHRLYTNISSIEQYVPTSDTIIFSAKCGGGGTVVRYTKENGESYSQPASCIAHVVIKQNGVELFSGMNVQNLVLPVEANVEITIESYIDIDPLYVPYDLIVGQTASVSWSYAIMY